MVDTAVIPPANRPVALQFEAVIVTPDKIIYEGKVKKMMVPGFTQEIAILPDHTPLYAELTAGNVVVTELTEKTKEFKIDGGILRVRSNKATVIASF